MKTKVVYTNQAFWCTLIAHTTRLQELVIIIIKSLLINHIHREDKILVLPIHLGSQ
jgi:hypothetical protein